MGAATTERPQSVENIKVLQVGKFGVRIDEKTWMGVNEPLTPQHFAVGSGYKVSVTTSKTGKKYINSIIGVEDAQTAPTTAPAETDAVKAAEEALKKAKANAEEAAAKAKAQAEAPKPATQAAGMDLKTRQIQRQGSFQAALQSPFLGQLATNVTEYLSFVRQAADEAVKYINE